MFFFFSFFVVQSHTAALSHSIPELQATGEDIVRGLHHGDTDHRFSKADGTLWNMAPLMLILAVFSFALKSC